AAAVVLDQAGATAAGPAVAGVPGPAEVGDVVGVGPGHVSVDVAVAAGALAELAGDHRVLFGDAEQDAAPVGPAGGEVVVVVGGDLGIGGVGRQVGEPAVEVAGPVDSGQHQGLLRPGRAHGFDQLPHPRRLVEADPVVFDFAAFRPAGPGHAGARLVVEV